MFNYYSILFSTKITFLFGGRKPKKKDLCSLQIAKKDKKDFFLFEFIKMFNGEESFFFFSFLAGEKGIIAFPLELSN